MVAFFPQLRDAPTAVRDHFLTGGKGTCLPKNVTDLVALLDHPVVVLKKGMLTSAMTASLKDGALCAGRNAASFMRTANLALLALVGRSFVSYGHLRNRLVCTSASCTTSPHPA